ncbi:hypothetical protein ACLVNP_00095 [Streptococcus pneumoniae]
MNIKKRVLSAGLTFASALLLAACGQSGSDTKTYSSTFFILLYFCFAGSLLRYLKMQIVKKM